MTLHARYLAPAVRTRPLTLGLLTPHNVHNPRSFSGTPFHTFRALEKRADIRLRCLGPHRPLRLIDRLPARLARVPAAAPAPEEFDGLDAVVGLVASGLLDLVPEGLPYIHATDATPGYLAEAYGWKIDATTHAREARVAARAALCLYSSEVMAKRAGAELGIAHVGTAPFGVNLTDRPETRPDRPAMAPIDLLYVGADWERKGGAIALDALDSLIRAGHAAHLTLVGRIPDHVRAHPHVTVAGFLDKRKPREARRLADLYARAHVLVLPTRGDCTPMVIAEAMAFGTPVLATETGGIPEMLGGCGAGLTLPIMAGADDWARAIRDMTDNRTGWNMRSDAAFDRAESRFSWDVWADAVIQHAKGLPCSARNAA